MQPFAAHIEHWYLITEFHFTFNVGVGTQMTDKNDNCDPRYSGYDNSKQAGWKSRPKQRTEAQYNMSV